MFIRRPHAGILLAIPLLLVAIPSLSRTWHVKQDGTGDATSIYGALGFAQSGDTILVSPGYYWEFQIYPAFAIHLISEAGPEVTTIRLLKTSPDDVNVVIMQNIGEPCSTIGFTIIGAQ